MTALGRGHERNERQPSSAARSEHVASTRDGVRPDLVHGPNTTEQSIRRKRYPRPFCIAFVHKPGRMRPLLSHRMHSLSTVVVYVFCTTRPVRSSSHSNYLLFSVSTEAQGFFPTRLNCPATCLFVYTTFV
jgi:hypothetical protein